MTARTWFLILVVIWPLFSLSLTGLWILVRNHYISKAGVPK